MKLPPRPALHTDAKHSTRVKTVFRYQHRCIPRSLIYCTYIGSFTHSELLFEVHPRAPNLQDSEHSFLPLKRALEHSNRNQSIGKPNPPREYPWQIRESRCLQPNTPEQLKEAIGPTPKPAFISGGHSRPAELDHHQTTHFKEGKLQVSFL